MPVLALDGISYTPLTLAKLNVEHGDEITKVFVEFGLKSDFNLLKDLKTITRKIFG